MYKYLFYDLDGTLTESGPGIMNSARYALAKMGIEEQDEGRLVKFVGPPLSESFPKFYGLNGENTELAIKYFREYFRSRGMFENKPYEGIEEVLAALKGAGYRQVVATSKVYDLAQQILEHFGLAQYFELVEGSDYEGLRGTKELVIREALKKLNISDPSEVLMIGDREHDVFGAAANRIDCLGVLYGYGSREELVNAGVKDIAITVEDVRRMLLNNKL